MKYFLDTEFLEDGKTIDLISIGMVAEDGREYYAVSTEFSLSRVLHDEWLVKNVVPSLPLVRQKLNQPWAWDNCYILPCSELKTRAQIANDIVEFISPGAVIRDPGEPYTDPWGDANPQFWGYYADYDWVAFCQLFGRMIELPKHFPRYCMDLKQLCNAVGNPQLPKQEKGEHNALEDARWNKQVYDFLVEQANRRFNKAVWDRMNLFTPDEF